MLALIKNDIAKVSIFSCDVECSVIKASFHLEIALTANCKKTAEHLVSPMQWKSLLIDPNNRCSRESLNFLSLLKLMIVLNG